MTPKMYLKQARQVLMTSKRHKTISDALDVVCNGDVPGKRWCLDVIKRLPLVPVLPKGNKEQRLKIVELTVIDAAIASQP